MLAPDQPDVIRKDLLALLTYKMLPLLYRAEFVLESWREGHFAPNEDFFDYVFFTQGFHI